MKQLAYCLFIIASLILPQNAFAQDAGELSQFQIKRIGVVDLNSIMRKAQATETVRALLDEKRAEFEQEFTQKESELLALERDLQEKRSIISEQAFAEAVSEFQRDVSSVQRDIQTKRQALDKAFQDSQDALREIAVEVIKDYSGEVLLDAVFDRNSAIIFRQELDITEPVLERLNARTKNARLISNTE